MIGQTIQINRASAKVICDARDRMEQSYHCGLPSHLSDCAWMTLAPILTGLATFRVVGNSEVMVGAAFFDLDKSKGWAIRIWHGAYRLFPYPARIEFHGSAAVCSPSRSYGLQPARWSLRNLRALG